MIKIETYNNQLKCHKYLLHILLMEIVFECFQPLKQYFFCLFNHMLNLNQNNY